MAQVLIYLVSYALERKQKRDEIVKTKENDEKLFNLWTDILSRWNQTEAAPRLARLLAYSHQIPNELRSNAWFVMSGAELLLTQNHNVYKRLIKIKPNSKCMKQINGDYHRSFSTKQIRDRFKNKLRRILIAYCNYNKSLPYTQGMNFIAAFILRQYFERELEIRFKETHDEEKRMENDKHWLRNIEEKAFWTFVALMNKIHMLYAADLIGLHKLVEVLNQLMNDNAEKELLNHLNKENVCTTLATKWYHTLFTKCGMNDNMINRVWDIFILEEMEFSILLKISYLILTHHKQKIIEMDFIEIIEFCTSECFQYDETDDYQLINQASKLKLNEMCFRDITNKKEKVITQNHNEKYCRMR
eukprot:114544_1